MTVLHRRAPATGSPTPPAAGPPVRLPPRWFVVAFWHGHRALVRATRGRGGLWRPGPHGWGAARLVTTGRRSGRRREVVVGYLEDGRNLVTMAMNGWAAPEPSWWLNLQAHPDALVQTRDGLRPVRAHAATGPERERLWARWAAVDENLASFAARRPAPTAVVVLEPRDGAVPVSAPGRTRRRPVSRPRTWVHPGAWSEDPRAERR